MAEASSHRHLFSASPTLVWARPLQLLQPFRKFGSEGPENMVWVFYFGLFSAPVRVLGG